MDLYLTRKTALVTGASTFGCGRAIATALAREGVAVAITARRIDALTKLARELKAEGCIEPVVIAADLYDPETPARLAARRPHKKALGAPNTTKHSSSLAMTKAQDSAGLSSQPVFLGLASTAKSRTDSSNPILMPKRSIHSACNP